jgi:hypothetical protein
MKFVGTFVTTDALPKKSVIFIMRGQNPGVFID